MDPVTRVQISAPAPLLKTIFYEIISMAKKGSAEERDLVHKLWERDFAAMRAPASGGATKKPLPDVVAGNGKLYLAIEAVSYTHLTLPTNREV